MTEALGDPVRKRSIVARVGVAALNIPLIGLGLLRLGRWQSALAWFAASFLVIAAMLTLEHYTPVPSFPILSGAAFFFLLAEIAILGCSVVATWRHSVLITRTPWWTRSYAIIPLILVLCAIQTQLPSPRDTYKNFYIASESMMPTFSKNEHIVADMRWRTPQIGNIILAHAPTGETRIYRVAALGGQTVAMKRSVPIIDGQAATQTPAGQMALGIEFLGKTSGEVLREHLPGERGTHFILKVMPSPQDDFPELRIPAGSVFLLGDDRDLSADSRIPVDEMGVGIVPVSAILGRPLYFLWSKDHHKIGQRADH